MNESSKNMFFSHDSWYCADHNQRYRLRFGITWKLACLFGHATNSHLRRASSYLLFSLAIADLIVTLICEPLLMEFIIQRTFLYNGLQSEPVPCVLHFNVSFLCHLSVTYGGYQSRSICCRCVPTQTQKLHGLKVMLIVSCSIPIFFS